MDGGEKLSPFVYWAQTKNQLMLKIDLKDVKQPDIEIRDGDLRFQATGIGARGSNNYKFKLNLYLPVDESSLSYKLLDSKIDLFIEKIEPNWWPRLTAQPQKPHWLKIDFDRWTTEDDLEDEQQNSARDIMQDYPGMYEQLQKEEYGYIKEQGKKVYLIFYNLAQFVGYLYVVVVMSILYYRDSYKALSATYETVGNAMKFCQLLQYLEVLHPMFGYTKGGVIVPFLQVTGRNFVLFAMIESESRMQTKPVVFYLFFIWSMIEVIRYPYYIVTLLKRNIPFLTWLRYTMWIPLYPMGILCEGIVLLRNIPYFHETQRFSIFLPNKWNFIFSMPAFIKAYIFLLILPGTYLVMTHMAKIRAKKLSTSASKKKPNKYHVK